MKRAWYDSKKDSIVILVRPERKITYEIEMVRCTTAGSVLDWIHQIHSKNWGHEVMQDMLDVLFTEISSDLWSGKA